MKAKMVEDAAATTVTETWPVSDPERKYIRVRDPFVVTDAANGRYMLLVASGEMLSPDCDAFGALRDEVRLCESKDLEHWSEPKTILKVPASCDCRAVWAPEMHEYAGKWYIFATLNYGLGRPGERGTWSFIADAPEGPFRPCSKDSLTPPGWSALDGTLWVEDGNPYLVFCHEWTQITNGEMCVVRLSADLSRADGEPTVLFRAGDVPDVMRTLMVTDGPFLFRETDGSLNMIWSSMLEGCRYCVIRSMSTSGRIGGPWGAHKVIIDNDGGHAMLFNDLKGRRRLALHRPNAVMEERMQVLPFDAE